MSPVVAIERVRVGEQEEEVRLGVRRNCGAHDGLAFVHVER